MDLTKTPKNISEKGIWLEDIGFTVNRKDIRVTPRIGVDYAGSDAFLPYRFVYKT
jgi:DNA-3-methyladenine glycosylase